MTRSELAQEIQDLSDTLADASKEALESVFGDTVVEQNWKTKYLLLIEKEKQLVKDGDAVERIKDDLNDSDYNRHSKQIIRCFCSEVNTLVHSVTVKNIDSTKNRIIKAYAGINSLFLKDGVRLSQHLLELKLRQSDTVYFSKE